MVLDLIFSHLLWSAEISEDEAENRLQDAIQEKFVAFGDVCNFVDIFTYCILLIFILALLYEINFFCPYQQYYRITIRPIVVFGCEW